MGQNIEDVTARTLPLSRSVRTEDHAMQPKTQQQRPTKPMMTIVATVTLEEAVRAIFCADASGGSGSRPLPHQ